MIRWLYNRYLYRAHMRLIHRLGLCRMTKFTPYGAFVLPSGARAEAVEYFRCEWCGITGERIEPCDMEILG